MKRFIPFCLLTGLAFCSFGRPLPYGNNPQAGRYYDAGGVKLYYEVYGAGEPVVLLHGGVYGYINEFEPFIKRLSETNRVICIATRGHGKSEIGHAPFSYAQRAGDACKIIRSLTKDSVAVIGFSDGAYSGFTLAALHPEPVKKLVAIGAGDHRPAAAAAKFNYTPEGLMKQDSALFAKRLSPMPEPGRWREALQMLNKLYNEETVSTETFAKIQCPVLVMSGDRDAYQPLESVVACARAISRAQLSVIPGCNHVVFFCNFPAVWGAVLPCLKNG